MWWMTVFAPMSGDWGKIKTQIKDGLSDFLWKKIKRNPVILPDNYGGINGKWRKEAS